MPENGSRYHGFPDASDDRTLTLSLIYTGIIMTKSEINHISAVIRNKIQPVYEIRDTCSSNCPDPVI